ncbi:MAG TPA: type III-B CRISPR module RAMP protein Cmr4 [Gemmataceae bacterium]|jgi:CRISPR-associated protein Cmr4|nr:type III-B CRISPR module RAMP protein Cmr4 [Gemmataceae bacterium]
MTTEIIGLLAETYIHPGTGQSAGAIDLPVARERVTQYPFIPGSSMKGALLDASRGNGLDTDRLFGQQENAGQLLVSDARLLLLPVRSLTSPYVWLTCPYLIERFRRDMERAGKGGALPKVTPLTDDKALAAGTTDLFLEERLFAVENKPPEELAAAIGTLIPHAEARARLSRQLAIVTDKAFAWFAQYALPVQARNVLDEEKKTSKNLWYEEALSPDTLMYFVLGERADGAATKIATFLAERRYLQAGGNETVGQGWFAVRRVEGAAS